MSAALARLHLDVATTFRLDETDRILRENDPDGGPGPRAYIAGCADGNLAFLRADVPQALADEVTRLVATAPPWSDPTAAPVFLDEVRGRLGATGPRDPGLAYALPPQPPAGSVGFICSETADGDALIADIALRGPPQHLVDAGFVSVADFWAPWCVILEGDVIAAIAFAARLAPQSAAVGLYTFPGFRRRGLGAAATARWTTLPALAGHTLFYGTSLRNISSQKVAQRLGLSRIGVSLRVP